MRRQTVDNEVIVQREWWFPCFVLVWRSLGESTDWKGRTYTTWLKRGMFLRRRTAEKFAEWERRRCSDVAL